MLAYSLILRRRRRCTASTRSTVTGIELFFHNMTTPPRSGGGRRNSRKGVLVSDAGRGPLARSPWPPLPGGTPPSARPCHSPSSPGSLAASIQSALAWSRALPLLRFFPWFPQGEISGRRRVTILGLQFQDFGMFKMKLKDYDKSELSRSKCSLLSLHFKFA